MNSLPQVRSSENETPIGDSRFDCRSLATREGIASSAIRFEKPKSGNVSMTWPFQSFSQIVFVLSGKITLSIPDAGLQRIAANEWFLLSLNEWQSQVQFSEDASLLAIECSKEIWQNLATPLDKLNHNKKACFGCAQRLEAVFFKNRLEPRLNQVSKELFQLKNDSPSSRLLAEAKTLELIALSVDHSSLTKSPSSEPCLRDQDQDALQLAAAYLETNLSAPHSLSKISRQVNLNEFKLKKGFREKFDTTVFGYLRQKRMEHARELLSKPQTSVLETAHAVGYSNPSHFTRAFRECFGLNPRDLISR